MATLPQRQNPYLTGSINQAVPGLPGLTRSATNIIQSELGGLPSPTETRTANAAWGAGAGLPPGTPFLENRGRRLYQSEIEQRQRQGLQDLLSFLQGYSGTVSATPGQLLSYNQNQQQQLFENAMAQRERDLAQRRIQDFENQPILEGTSIPSGTGQPFGVSTLSSRRRGVVPSAYKFFT